MSCGSGVSARAEAEQYGKDLEVLKELVKELYPKANTQPKVLGPGGFYDANGSITSFRLQGQMFALLWHRLMGKNVLSTTHNGSPYLRAYSHCSKKKPGISMLLINMLNSTIYEVSIENDVNLHPRRLLEDKENGGGQRGVPFEP
ncbi:hypothetical protein LguiA_000413 [Lonicera macranthoides]